MKKTFKLTDPKKAPDRQLEFVKAEINRYLKRERNKPLPEGVDFWDFDCRIGESPEVCEPTHVAEIGKKVDLQKQKGLETFYLEILAKPGRRTKKT